MVMESSGYQTPPHCPTPTEVSPGKLPEKPNACAKPITTGSTALLRCTRPIPLCVSTLAPKGASGGASPVGLRVVLDHGIGPLTFHPTRLGPKLREIITASTYASESSGLYRITMSVLGRRFNRLKESGLVIRRFHQRNCAYVCSLARASSCWRGIARLSVESSGSRIPHFTMPFAAEQLPSWEASKLRARG